MAQMHFRHISRRIEPSTCSDEPLLGAPPQLRRGRPNGSVHQARRLLPRPLPATEVGGLGPVDPAERVRRLRLPKDDCAPPLEGGPLLVAGGAARVHVPVAHVALPLGAGAIAGAAQATVPRDAHGAAPTPMK